MENDKTLFYIVAIVAIVAVFGMVFMSISGAKTTKVVASESSLTTDNAGQAIASRTLTSKDLNLVSSNSNDVTTSDNVTAPPFVITVCDTCPLSDIYFLINLHGQLSSHYSNLPTSAFLFSDINGLKLDNQVTLAVKNGRAYTIVGEHSPGSYYSVFALDVNAYASRLGVTPRTIISNQVTSSDLNNLFRTTPPPYVAIKD